jgi:methionyl-tRNA formyltransferase
LHKNSGKEIAAKLFFALQVEDRSVKEPGTIESDGKTFIKVACGSGWLQLTDLQIAGKKRMKITDFLRGFQQINEHRFK